MTTTGIIAGIGYGLACVIYIGLAVREDRKRLNRIHRIITAQARCQATERALQLSREQEASVAACAERMPRVRSFRTEQHGPDEVVVLEVEAASDTEAWQRITRIATTPEVA